MLIECAPSAECPSIVPVRPFGSDLMEFIAIGTPASMGGTPTMCNTGAGPHPKVDKDDTK
jgi:hypothetical protein